VAAVIAPVGGMLAGSAAVWAVVLWVFGPAVARDVALGIAGPLVAVVVTWVLVVRTHRRSPADVTRVMVAGFAGKMIFFGVYVVAVWTEAAPDPIPFIASFTGSFLTLYGVEAILLDRLFRSGPRTS
jgi:putative effector of murein hydrolase LrgA (UPF0299 family)